MVTGRAMPHHQPLANEGPEAFAAFCCFRDMQPLSRTLGNVARTLGKSVSLIRRWSALYQWTRRVWAADLEREEDAPKRIEEANREVEENQKSAKKQKERRAAKSAAVTNSQAAIQFALRIAEVEQNLEKIPIENLHKLM